MVVATAVSEDGGTGADEAGAAVAATWDAGDIATTASGAAGASLAGLVAAVALTGARACFATTGRVDNSFRDGAGRSPTGRLNNG